MSTSVVPGCGLPVICTSFDFSSSVSPVSWRAVGICVVYSSPLDIVPVTEPDGSISAVATLPSSTCERNWV
jgi:hypothetical protein